MGAGRQVKWLFLAFNVLCVAMSLSFDLSQVDKHGDTLSSATVNAETVIDLAFSPNTIISGCSPTGCLLVDDS